MVSPRLDWRGSGDSFTREPKSGQWYTIFLACGSSEEDTRSVTGWLGIQWTSTFCWAPFHAEIQCSARKTSLPCDWKFWPGDEIFLLCEDGWDIANLRRRGWPYVTTRLSTYWTYDGERHYLPDQQIAMRYNCFLLSKVLGKLLVYGTEYIFGSLSIFWSSTLFLGLFYTPTCVIYRNVHSILKYQTCKIEKGWEPYRAHAWNSALWTITRHDYPGAAYAWTTLLSYGGLKWWLASETRETAKEANSFTECASRYTCRDLTGGTKSLTTLFRFLCFVLTPLHPLNQPTPTLGC